LRDTGNYIAGLSKREHDKPAWLAAIQALILVVEHGGDTTLPGIGIMRALYPGEGAPYIASSGNPTKLAARPFGQCKHPVCSRMARAGNCGHPTVRSDLN
jgi:hypothetical protein